MNEIVTQLDASPPQHGILHGCFFGASGLRAGWRLLIFGVLFITFTLATSIAACILVPALRSHRTAPLLIIAQEGLSFVCLLLAGWVMAKFPDGWRAGSNVPLLFLLSQANRTGRNNFFHRQSETGVRILAVTA